MMPGQKMWQGTTKRVPLAMSQQLGPGVSTTFQVIPQFPFRGENIVVDPAIAASVSVQAPSVGPNVQLAGGSNNVAFSGQTFPPTQTRAMEWGMDIANEGNQLSLTVASTLTTGNVTFAGLIMGTITAEMTPQQAGKHLANVAAGISPAGNFRAGLSPAGAYVP